MNVLIEEILIYGSVLIFCIFIVFIYLRKQKQISLVTRQKIMQAKENGLYEPISLHPVIDINSCIKTGACISACPETDILGIVDGKATVINASVCIGHGACFHACPTEAISLCIGTEKRGVDLPHVNQTFETNVSGIYISGELGGMGLIKNAVEQGKQAADNIAKTLKKGHTAQYDLIIVGAGPSGIAAALQAKKHNLRAINLEQNSLGGTVFTFPRKKIIMTSPMDLPLFGKLKLYETSKTELLELWKSVIEKYGIQIKENTKVEAILFEGGKFSVTTSSGETLSSQTVLLAIGRRGSPRKLNITGEESEKVAYRLLEPELISGKNILVVGGGDSAIESALLLADNNNVTLSYRGEKLNRLKPKNRELINQALELNKLTMLFNSNPSSIDEKVVKLTINENEEIEIDNDLVYIFAGGELPTEFLKKTGIQITRKFGEAVLKH